MSKSLARQACDLLSEDWQFERVKTVELTPDGSQRRFCRLIHDDGTARVAIAPPNNDFVALEEAVAGWNIGRHLLVCGAPVPKLFAFDKSSGLLICEDLGDTRLHDLIMSPDCDIKQVRKLYEQVVVHLARMQVRSFADFKTDWCWDSPKYDQKIMLERESGYFLQALCSDMLKIPVDRQPVEREFEDLADLAGQAEANFFLHRDFQSRNIMIKQGKAHFIDYQAGRLGPLGYDLASLLVDPYAALPAGMQDGLVACYLDELTQLVPYDKEQFKKEYLVLSLQRNLQILGAFAFLSHRRGKPFFQQYIKPALHSLQTNLARVPHEDYPFLNGLVEQCLTIV